MFCLYEPICPNILPRRRGKKTSLSITQVNSVADTYMMISFFAAVMRSDPTIQNLIDSINGVGQAKITPGLFRTHGAGLHQSAVKSFFDYVKKRQEFLTHEKVKPAFSLLAQELTRLRVSQYVDWILYHPKAPVDIIHPSASMFCC